MDARLKENMNEDVKKIMHNKNLGLIHKLIEQSGFKDKELLNDLVSGFRTIGPLGACGEFEEAPVGAAPRKEDLFNVAKWSQKAVKGYLNQVSKGCWKAYRASLKEARENKLKGPFTAEQVTALLGPLWVPTPRFIITQGRKNGPLTTTHTLAKTRPSPFRGVLFLAAWMR